MDIRCKLAYSLMGHYKKLLDVGCGTGKFTQLWAEKAEQVTCIDSQAVRLADAPKNNPHIEFIQMDALSTSFSPDSFDGIIAGDIIEHFKDPHPFLMEMKRVLKSNGDMIVTTPNGRRPSTIFWRLVGKPRKFPREVGHMQDNRQLGDTDLHYFEYNISELRKIFNDCGFRIVKVKLTSPIDYFTSNRTLNYLASFGNHIGNVYAILVKNIK